MKATLTVDAARLHQGDFTLAASFTAPGDGITALFGPSGAGKSTVLAAVAGLKRLSAGQILMGDKVLAGERTHIAPHRRNIGLVFQDARLFPHLTVRQNLTYAARRAPQGGPAIGDIAQFFDIGALLERPVGNLSGGEKSRVALARALAAAPDFLLLDEPFAALDGARRRAYIRILYEMHRVYALPMLIVTHAIDDAAALASHLVALKDGRVVASGPFIQTALTPAFQALLDARDTGAALSGGDLRRAEAKQTGNLWLRADHVVLAAQPPQAISARNILAGHVETLSQEEGGGVLVALRTDTGIILSRITPEAAQELKLVPGARAWAIVKAHAA